MELLMTKKLLAEIAGVTEQTMRFNVKRLMEMLH